MATSIDFQLNYPILEGQEELFAQLLAKVSTRTMTMLELPPFQGRDEHRQSAAEWLSSARWPIPKERVLLCAGGHHAVMVALLALGLRNSRIAVDPLTYGNFKVQAASLGIDLIACEGDELGMKPDALEEAAKRDKLRAVYLMPTVHNPLGTVMPESRRREICQISTRYDLLILDDDAYRFLEVNAPPSFAALEPDRAISVWSLTKPVAPIMKLSFLIAPERYVDKLTTTIRVTSSGASVMFAEMGARLIQCGALCDLIAGKRDEAALRQRVARDIFGDLKVRSHPTSYHLWIDLPSSDPANVIADSLEADGILVSSVDVFRATPKVEANGLRIALGNVRHPETLREGLERVRAQIGRTQTSNRFS